MGRAPPTKDDAAELPVVRDLAIRFPDRYGDIPVVDSLNFTVHEGETLGLVGESGCGKSITSLAVMGLLARNAEVSGEILYRGRDLLKLPEGTPRPDGPGDRDGLPGRALLPQSFRPRRGAAQAADVARRYEDPGRALELVGLSPERTLRSYPHELSGGQCQRVLIAMALSRSPRLLIADEPTTALDVTVQAQVVELLIRLRDELGFAMVLVSHDLALVGDLSHRVAVMYAGRLAEVGDTRSVLTDPAHHYSRGLLGSVVSLEAGADRLHQIRGVVPAPQGFGTGCRFTSRCAAATDLCRGTTPDLTARGTEKVWGDWAAARSEQDRLVALFDIIGAAAAGTASTTAAGLGAFRTALMPRGVIATIVMSPPMRRLDTTEKTKIAAFLDRAGLSRE